MVVETIYVVRHGHRMNFTVDPSTGVYSTAHPTPTGVPADPELAKYGVDQSRELAEKLAGLEPQIDVFYCSPFYRCLQTLKPTIVQMRRDGKILKSVRVEDGISEFFGSAPFAHPRPAPLEQLEKFFDFINMAHKSAIIPFEKGESIEELHDRNAYAMHRIISEVDSEPGNPKVILICTHAACMIAIGRALTGHMPEDETEEDFRCGTCALSKFVRRSEPSNESDDKMQPWSVSRPSEIPKIDWRNGKGVKGGWDCVANGDCSFMRGGEERTWNFSMDPVEKKVQESAAVDDTCSEPPAQEIEALSLSTRDSNAAANPSLDVTENETADGSPNLEATCEEVPSKVPQSKTTAVKEDEPPMQKQAPAA